MVTANAADTIVVGRWLTVVPRSLDAYSTRGEDSGRDIAGIRFRLSLRSRRRLRIAGYGERVHAVQRRHRRDAGERPIEATRPGAG